MKTSKRGLNGPVSSVALTEFSDLDPDTLHLVRRGANGFPALLAKSLASEIKAAKSEVNLPRDVLDQVDAQRRYRTNAQKQQETNDLKKQKIRQVTTWPAPKRAKKLRKQLAAQGQPPGAIKTVTNAENVMLRRVAELERAVGAALAKGIAGRQEADSLNTLLWRERSRLGRVVLMKAAGGLPSFDDFRAVDAYMGAPIANAARAQHMGSINEGPAETFLGNPDAEARASRAAAARSVEGALGDPMNKPRLAPYDALSAVRDGTGRAATLPVGRTELPSQVEIHRLEKALSDAKSPQERESLGYQLTRMQLIRSHMLGEL